MKTIYTTDVDSVAPYFNPPAQVDSSICDGDACGLQTRIVYAYDDYGNVVREDQHGDLNNPADDRTIVRSFNPNTASWITGLPASEAVYSGIGTANKVSETTYYYDGGGDCSTPSTNQTPTLGNLTRVVRWLVNPDGTDPADPETLMGYDGYGNLVCFRDANEKISTTIYDSSFTFPIAVTNPKGHQTVIQYYGVDGVSADKGLYGQVKSTTDPNGAIVSKEYDSLGRLVKVANSDTAGLPYGTVSYTYENFGQASLQSVRNVVTTCPPGYSYNSVKGECEATPSCSNGAYDVASGMCASGYPFTLPLYSSATFYDPSIVFITAPPPPLSGSIIGYLSSVVVDSASNQFFTMSPYETGYFSGAPRDGLVAYTSCSKSGAGITTYKVSSGDISCSSGATRLFPSGETKLLMYASPSPWVDGETSAPFCPSGGTLDAAAGKCEVGGSIWHESYFDGFGRTFKTRSQGPENKVIVTETSYDSRGAAAGQSFPYFEGIETPQWSGINYDSMGRPNRLELPDGSAQSACYDDGVTVTIDANGHRKRETRDALGRLAKVEEYEGAYAECTTEAGTPYSTITYQYDVLGNLRFVTDVRENQTEMRYDTLGRKTFMHDPDMGDWTYAYDGNSNLSSQTDAKGQSVIFRYDDLNRPTLKDYPSGSDVIFTYDEAANGYAKGRLTTMADASGTTKIYYDDPHGKTIRSVKNVDGVSYSITASLDDLGRISSLTYPDNETIGYTYDGGGNLRQVGAYATYAGYNALGQPGTVVYGNWTTTTYRYNSDNKRLWTLAVDSPTQSLLNLEYSYDPEGNVWNILNYRDASKGQSFRYDSLDRLTQAQSTAYGTLSYSYDQIGNLLGKEGITHTPHALRPHAIGATSDGKSYSYDGNGNMISDGQRTITWDYDNRPSSITYGDTTSFVYDGAGNRVKKTGPAGTIVYIDKLYECSGGVCAKYIFANGQRIALKSDTATLYYHQDHLGSTGVVTDAQGNKVEDIYYKPFGESLLDSGAFSLNHKYTGQEFDPETGLYYYNARYYNPSLGRFVSADTIVSDPTNPQSFNRFSYVLNNPLRFTDPSGYSEYDSYGGYQYFSLGSSWYSGGGWDSYYPSSWNVNTYLSQQDSFYSWMSQNASSSTPSSGSAINFTQNSSSLPVAQLYQVVRNYKLNNMSEGLRSGSGLGKVSAVSELLSLMLLDSIYSLLPQTEEDAFVFGLSGPIESIAVRAARALPQSEASAVKRINNILDTNFNFGPKGDIAGAVSDMVGNPIAKPGGGYYDHVQDLGNMLRGLRNHTETLRTSMDPAAKVARERALKTIQEIETAIKGSGL